MPATGRSDIPEALPFPGARRLRTDDWPQQDRIAMFRDQFGRGSVRVEPLPDHPLRIDATIAKLPGLGLIWGTRSPLRSEFSDGSDRLLFSLAGAAVATQVGQDVELGPGDAVALCGADEGAFVTLAPGPIVTLEFPNGAIAPLLADVGTACWKRIPQDAPALQLLQTYLWSFLAVGANAAPSLLSLATAHILDLAALAIGASRQTKEIAGLRGIPAARLQRIREDILNRLAAEITLEETAARHSVSPRYVRSLFECQGTTFSEFVRDERLLRARRTLLSAQSQAMKISDIAYSVGFNDLSYFNRAFRRRFGCSPRELQREQSV